MEVPELSKLMDQSTKWWADFWSQPGAKEITEKNIGENAEAFGNAVITLQKSWKERDYENAGKTFATGWGILLGKPDLTSSEEKESGLK